MLTKKSQSARGEGAGRRATRPRRVTDAGVAKTSRRQDILERAVGLMQEKGFVGTSVQHVADALEFSKANFFYHIESKEALLYQIFVENLEYTARHLEEILRRDLPTPDKWRAIVEFYARMMIERASVMQIWYKEKGHLTVEHQKDVTRLERHLTTILEAFYEQGMAERFFREMDPKLARVAIFGMCFNLTRWQQSLAHLTIDQISAQIQALAGGGLLTR